MISPASICLCAIFAATLGACSGGSSNGNRLPSESTKQTLEVSGSCTFDSCGTMPSSLESVTRVSCSGGGNSCTWSDAADNTSVSYRACADSECPARPSIQCPNGTSQASQTCGSENEAPCSWTTSCVPPRVTTPCPDSHGCDNQPLIEIGIICRDGAVGGFACVTDGKTCYRERNCD